LLWAWYWNSLFSICTSAVAGHSMIPFLREQTVSAVLRCAVRNAARTAIPASAATQNPVSVCDHPGVTPLQLPSSINLIYLSGLVLAPRNHAAVSGVETTVER
jgi:hypothetical protein